MNQNFIKPKSSLHIECSVLGTILQIGTWSDTYAQQAMLKLDPDCFYHPEPKLMFETIQKCFNMGRDVTMEGILPYLPDGLNSFYFEVLAGHCYSSSSLMTYVNDLIAFKTARRQLKAISNTLAECSELVVAKEITEAINEGLKDALQAHDHCDESHIRTYEQILDDMLTNEDMDDGSLVIDAKGFPPVPAKAMITIAGRSGHGKTYFALYLMDKIIDKTLGCQSLFFNLEMDERVMVERHANLVTPVMGSSIETLKRAAPILLPKNVKMISKPMITIDEIETTCRLASLKQPLAVVVVDYIGLVRSKKKSDSKYLEQSDIAQRLSGIALELNCRVIALIQVNRENSKRAVGDRCPVPSDAADSMGSVNSSSWWIGIDQPQIDSDKPEYKDLYMVAWRKIRGKEKPFCLHMDFKSGRFYERKRPFCTSAPVKGEHFDID